VTRRKLFGAVLFASSTVFACGSGDSNPSPSSSDGGAGTPLSTGGTGNESGAGGGSPASSGGVGGAGTPGTGVGGTTDGTGGATSGGSSGSTSGGSSGAASGGSSGSSGGASGAGGATEPEPDSGSASTCAPSSDACPMSSGLVHACEQRFALGLNYAWHNFSCDFGGLSAWNTKGVSDDPTTVDTDLAAMHAAGASVIRWWVFPDFRGDGISFDANGDPSGITTTAVADVQKALDLAKKNDVYLVFTVFSFDAFRPDTTDSGVLIRSIAPMVTNATRRAKVIENVVRPLARAAAGSDAASHLLGWDVINEPEWAVTATGNAPGGQDFTPNSELTTVSLADMKSLIDETAQALKAEAPDSLTSVGWAAAKWAWAFDDVTNIDFDQPHIYGWVDQYWPYTKNPADLGYGKKPTVMGEFYLQPMPFSDGGDNVAFAQILSSWWDNGYAGAWAWQYADESQNLTLLQSFKTTKGCPAGF